ncbi:Acyltransferase family protein [Paraurantiacibacter namhicola]|uniref:Acyltransferase family protein n=2 Tax=Paraurantiacibacter namhicola TaxID=645517 RepID=A0A1C7D7R7_9SPHN|nr:Acyltransferase family protein [Paraurantiacibacter namhicola]
MREGRFITPEMSILLDLIRGLAALVVLGGHMVQMEIYTGPYPLTETAQHNAVLIFFVLSGLVISHSVRTRPQDLRTYAVARAARIFPVSLFALLFGLALFTIARSMGLEASLEHVRTDAAEPANLLLPILFLGDAQGVVLPPWNPPYWSLAYEVWFYALFGAAFFLRGKLRAAALLVLSLLAGWRVLLLMPSWLLGVWLSGKDFRPGRQAALALGLLGWLVMLFATVFGVPAANLLLPIVQATGVDFNFSTYFITDNLFAIGVAICFVALRPLAAAKAALLERWAGPIRWLAGCSFSLYILHWPIISAMSAFGMVAGKNAWLFAAYALAILAFCALTARVTEHRSGDVRKWMMRVTQRRALEAPARA